MSKFIKVQLEFNDEWVLLNTDEIFEIGKDRGGRTKILMKGGSYTVHQKIEQIEAQLLRDELAKEAMNGLIVGVDFHSETLAQTSYEIADAMLKERLK